MNKEESDAISRKLVDLARQFAILADAMAELKQQIEYFEYQWLELQKEIREKQARP